MKEKQREESTLTRERVCKKSSRIVYDLLPQGTNIWRSSIKRKIIKEKLRLERTAFAFPFGEILREVKKKSLNKDREGEKTDNSITNRAKGK